MVLYNVPIYEDQSAKYASRNHENDVRRQSYNATAPKAERPSFRQSGVGVISGEGWDSFSRMTAAGLMESPRAKPEPPPFYQSGKGVISATPLETEEEKPEIELVPIEKSDLISGVVAAGVSLNALRPLQPFPGIWDVFSSPVALIDGGLSGFRLPDPSATINSYMSRDLTTEYDAECLLEESSPTRQRIPNAGEHNSYMIQATAIIRSLDIDALPIIETAAVASGVNVLHTGWSGIHAYGDEMTGRLGIMDHYVIGSGSLPHRSSDGGSPSVTMTPPDPNAVSRYQTGVFDLLFYAVDGATWQLIVARTS